MVKRFGIPLAGFVLLGIAVKNSLKYSILLFPGALVALLLVW
jgi:hypothetical protein